MDVVRSYVTKPFPHITEPSNLNLSKKTVNPRKWLPLEFIKMDIFKWWPVLPQMFDNWWRLQIIFISLIPSPSWTWLSIFVSTPSSGYNRPHILIERKFIFDLRSLMNSGLPCPLGCTCVGFSSDFSINKPCALLNYKPGMYQKILRSLHSFFITRPVPFFSKKEVVSLVSSLFSY